MITIPALTSPTLLRLDYVSPGEDSAAIAFSFAHPVARRAVGTLRPIDDPPASAPMLPEQGIEILFVPVPLNDDGHWKEGARTWMAAGRGTAGFAIRAGDMHVQWRPGRAVIAAPAHSAHDALESVVECSYYESVLQQIEQAIGSGWNDVEADTSLAYAAHPPDLENEVEVGQRMQRVMQTRLRLSRIEPALLRSAEHLCSTARELGEALRDAALCEDRLETADGQIETQEYVYELASQRLGESRHARQGFVLEMAIIILLAAEVVLIIFDILRNLE